ncbi:MAG: hypothetical protein H7249_17380 [Chitinophagaceae bacterium]|nr:hypothetical protein [Oligoflexus sp.]
MKRRLWPYLIFALLGNSLALWVYVTASEERDTGEVWESFKFEDIKAVSYKTETLKAKFTPLSINYGWIEFANTGKGVKASSHAFLAGPKGKELWFNLSPFWASKVLGDSKQLDLKSFGLDKADKHFALELNNGKTMVYDIGGRGFQSSDYYVLDPQREKAFLWDRQTINLLESAPERLSLDNLNFLLPETAKKIVLDKGGITRTLTRVGHEWVDADKVLSPSDFLLQWLDKVGRLKAGGYVDTIPKGNALFKLSVDAETPWNITFYKDEPQHAFLLKFSDDKPLMVIEDKIFAPFYEELSLGKTPAKN